MIWKYQKLSKRAWGCIFVNDLIEVIIKNIILMMILYFTYKIFPSITITIFKVLISIDILYLIIAPIIKYERYRYAITKNSIEVKEGFLFVKIDIVPIERIHKIIIKEDIVQKLFNLSKVVLTTAGGDVTIKFLDYKKVKVISDMLNQRINQIAKEEKLQSKV